MLTQAVFDGSVSKAYFGCSNRAAVYLALALSAGLYVAICQWILPVFVMDADVDIASVFRPDIVGQARPEPRERAAFQIGLLLTPFLPLLLYIGFERTLRHCHYKCDSLFGSFIEIALFAASIGGIYWVSVKSELPRATAVISTWCVLGVALISMLCWTRAKQTFGRLALGLLIFGVGVAIYHSMITDEHFWGHDPTAHHLDLIVSVVNQVMSGKTVLLDSTSQYGILYPYLVALWCSFFGLSLPSLSVFMILMMLLCYTIFFRVLWKYSRGDAAIASLTTLAILGWTVPMSAPFLFSDSHDMPHVYFQWMPLRVIAIAGCVLLVQLSLEHPRNKRAVWVVSGYALLAVGVIWNIDMGIVAIVAWAGTLWYHDMGELGLTLRHLLRVTMLHGAGLCLSVVTAFAGYSIFAYSRSGNWVHITESLLYQSSFYRHGFMMLPMRIVELWQPLIALYVIVIFSAGRDLWHGQVNSRTSLRLCIALLGCGIFAYYQGRSHISCLVAVVYPAVLLSGLLLFDSIELIRKSPHGRLWSNWSTRLAAMHTLHFSLLIVGGLALATKLGIGTFSGAVKFSKTGTEQIERDLDPVRRLLDTGPIVIFSRFDGWLHMVLRTHSPLRVGSMTETLLLSQVEEIDQQIRKGRFRYILVTPGAPNWPTVVLERSLDLGGYRPCYYVRNPSSIELVLYTNYTVQ